MTSRYKVVAFAGSNSTQSINKRLATHAADVLNNRVQGGVDIDILDLNDFDMPVYSPEREGQGIPKQAHDFIAKLAGADALIVSLAEHNGSYSAAFKNLFDWSSRVDQAVFQQKPMLLMATSPGGRGGIGVHSAAMTAFPHFGANIVANFQFGKFSEQFDQDANRLQNPDLITELEASVDLLKASFDTQVAA